MSQSYRRWMHLGRNIHSWMFSESVSQSLFHQVWNAVSSYGQTVCLKKMFNGEILHVNRRLKKLLLQVKRLIQNIVKFRTEKKLCTVLSSTKHLFECQKYCTPNIVQQCSWKEGIWKFIFPWRKVNWHVL